MEFKNKKISIAGFGKSGKSIAEILLKNGNEIFISDSGEESKFTELIKELDSTKVTYEFGGHTSKIYEGKDLIIISPGVSIYTPAIQEAIKHNVPVMGEVEIAYEMAKADIIAITGTNGKSATVSMIDKMLKDHGLKSILAGNIGTPLSYEICNHKEADYIVAEISSFQLESISKFRPHIAGITNITDDHTDRHHGFENYVKAKARIFMNQTENDFAILNADDKNVLKAGEGIKSKILFFSMEKEVNNGFYLKNGIVYNSENNISKECFNINEFKIHGIHNIKNLLTTLCVGKILNISPKEVLSSINEYKLMHHRLEFSGEKNGVKFYDDSKGTNPGAVIAGINSFSCPIALIVGGRNKGLDFDEMAKEIAQKVHTLVCIGEAGPEIGELAKKHGMKNIINCGTDFTKAITEAYKSVENLNGCVLLSPANASFDMFKSAENRGDIFKEIVQNLIKRS